MLFGRQPWTGDTQRPWIEYWDQQEVVMIGEFGCCLIIIVLQYYTSKLIFMFAAAVLKVPEGTKL